ncbi:MAG: hypothetical protein JWO38_8278 [Gemmataceae bacterium]|nr:hypothetical protein [Gemmataceae bacterium]
MPAHPILAETCLTLAQASSSLPAIGGKPFRVKRLYVWKDLGIKVGKARVVLETCKFGGQVVTSEEALERFFAATRGPDAPAIKRSPAAREKAGKAAGDWVRKRMAEIKVN